MSEPVPPGKVEPALVELRDDMQGLGRRAARGAFVTLGGQSARIVLQVGGVVVLARLLAPEDYGLIAMVTAVTGIGELFRDFGLSSAAVQAARLTAAQRTNLFWLNSVIGFALTVVSYCLAGPIAALYHQPALIPVVQALSLTFALNGMATQFRADLTRRMRFLALATVDVLGAAVALAAAITLALLGVGYWALVAQQLTTAVMLLIGAASVARWWPGLPRRHEPMRALLSFGWNLLATQLVGYASNNIDSLTIGVRFGATPLGLYNRAWQLLMSTLSQLRAPTTTVALPILARLREEPRRFAEFVRRGQLALAYSLVGGLALVATTADQLTEILLGSQWSAAAPLLRLLAIAGAFQTLAYVGYWVYLARALTKVLLRYTLVASVIKIAGVVMGSRWGVVGVAAGYALAEAVSWPLSITWLSRHTDVERAALLRGAGRTLALFGFAGALAWFTGSKMLAASPWLVWIAEAGVFTSVVAVFVLIVPRYRRDVKDVAAVVRAARGRAA